MSAAVKLSSPATREFWEIPVLHEDEHLLALDKPAGLQTAPDPLAPERPSLMGLLHEGIKAAKPWATQRNLSYLVNAHRLDTETTGVILLAKNKEASMALADLFSSEKPVRKYVTLVQGVPPDDAFEVSEKIGPHPLREGHMRIDSRNGKKSHTEFSVLERFSRWALLRCLPRTERQQQIPLHLDYAGFPVVGDIGHGGKQLWLSRLKKDFYLKPGREERPLLGQLTLHSEELELVHPVTQVPLVIKSEWPKDLRVALKYLRLYAAQ